MADPKPPVKTYPCETGPMKLKAEANPHKFTSRLWRWHTTWGPGWKAYQKNLTETRG